MDVEIGGCVGICESDDKGNIIKIEREYFQQGWIFKDWRAFRDSMDASCYVPELDDTVYTKRDFLALCNNQEEIAEELFEQLNWQSPSTLLVLVRKCVGKVISLTPPPFLHPDCCGNSL